MQNYLQRLRQDRQQFVHNFVPSERDDPTLTPEQNAQMQWDMFVGPPRNNFVIANDGWFMPNERKLAPFLPHDKKMDFSLTDQFLYSAKTERSQEFWTKWFTAQLLANMAPDQYQVGEVPQGDDPMEHLSGICRGNILDADW